LAGIHPQQIHDDLRHSILPGSRKISDREITEAVNKALSDFKGGTFTPRPRPTPVVKDGKTALQRIINQGKIHDEVDLLEASPIRLWDEPHRDPGLLLETLSDPDDHIFIGERYKADTIKLAAKWIPYYTSGGKTAPHICINPLTGLPAPKKSGDGETLRGDGCVSSFKYCMVEFDTLSREDQIRFWSAVKLPIVALIDSGGKSIHAWLQVSQIAKVETSEQWEAEIKQNLYDRLLAPLGVDSACSNPARLSRLPGHFREEKQAYQRLLWLSPEGRPIC
jgi:hypothetical protein